MPIAGTKGGHDLSEGRITGDHLMGGWIDWIGHASGSAGCCRERSTDEKWDGAVAQKVEDWFAAYGMEVRQLVMDKRGSGQVFCQVARTIARMPNELMGHDRSKGLVV